MNLKDRLLSSFKVSNTSCPEDALHTYVKWSYDTPSPFSYPVGRLVALDVCLKAKAVYTEEYNSSIDNSIELVQKDLVRSVLQEVYGDQRDKLIKATIALHNRDIAEALYILRKVIEDME